MQLAAIGEVRSQLDTAWSRPARISQTRVSVPAVDSAVKKAPSSLFIERHTAIAIAALLAGTGGVMTAGSIAERDQRGYRLVHFEYPAGKSPTKNRLHGVRNAAENLARLKVVFDPSVTDLASLFGVSRQTIYNWQAGLPLAEENEDRLERLVRASDIIARHGLAKNHSVLRRPLADGKGFFALIRDGHDSEEMARLLVDTVQREQQQRKGLDERLANRTRKPVDIDDLGIPGIDTSI